MKVLGILLGLLAVVLFYSATISSVPVDSAYALGYNLGIHAAWICSGAASYWLLRKR